MKSAPAIIVLAAVAALVVFTRPSPAPAQPAPLVLAWEYKMLPLTYDNPRADEKALTELGAAGWEVVEYTNMVRGGATSLSSDSRLVLKRQKR
jgi:hypothetical protein